MYYIMGEKSSTDKMTAACAILFYPVKNYGFHLQCCSSFLKKLYQLHGFKFDIYNISFFQGLVVT